MISRNNQCLRSFPSTRLGPTSMSSITMADSQLHSKAEAILRETCFLSALSNQLLASESVFKSTLKPLELSNFVKFLMKSLLTWFSKQDRSLFSTLESLTPTRMEDLCSVLVSLSLMTGKPSIREALPSSPTLINKTKPEETYATRLSNLVPSLLSHKAISSLVTSLTLARLAASSRSVTTPPLELASTSWMTQKILTSKARCQSGARSVEESQKSLTTEVTCVSMQPCADRLLFSELVKLPKTNSNLKSLSLPSYLQLPSRLPSLKLKAVILRLLLQELLPPAWLVAWSRLNSPKYLPKLSRVTTYLFPLMDLTLPPRFLNSFMIQFHPKLNLISLALLKPSKTLKSM